MPARKPIPVLSYSNVVEKWFKSKKAGKPHGLPNFIASREERKLVFYPEAKLMFIVWCVF